MVGFLERVISGEWNDDDLIKAFRSLKRLWGIVLGTNVCLALKDGEIYVETPAKTIKMGASRGNKPTDGDKLEAYMTIEKLGKMLSKLTLKQREAIFWRLIDDSKENDKPASNEELANMLGIARTTFIERLYSAWERLGGNSTLLRDFLVYELLRENYPLV